MRNCLLLLFILFCVPSFAQTPAIKPIKDTVSFRKKMEAQSKLISSIECDFTQEKFMSAMSEKIVSKGHFKFKKANMLRWEYTEPKKYLVTINKDKMFVKDNGKVSKFDIAANKIFKGINEMMMATVEGTLLNSKDYKVSYFESDKYFILELQPLAKGMKKFLASIQLSLNKTDYSVEKVRMTEQGGDYTLIDFTNRKTNQPIADDQFTMNK